MENLIILPTFHHTTLKNYVTQHLKLIKLY